MKQYIVVIILFFIATFSFADEKKQPAAPVPPTPPTKPVVPGAPENNGFLKMPPLPTFPTPPSRDEQSDGKIYEVEKYNLTVSEALANGEARQNAANTINSAQYTLYSNKTIMIKLFFKNGVEYTYHLRNPGTKVELSTGVFRERFDVVVQAGKEFLLEQYAGELTYNDNAIISLNIIGNNKVVVLLKFVKSAN